MVVIGVDAHKRTHTVVAVDEAGRKLTERTAPATADGHLELLGWSRTWPDHTWALEDCRNLTRRLEADARPESPARAIPSTRSRSLGRLCVNRTCPWLDSMAASASSVS